MVEGVAAPPRRHARVTIDGEPVEYRYAWAAATLWLHTAHGDFAFECRRRASARTAGVSGDAVREVRSSINGRVVDVAAQVNAPVARGDRLVVLEAMKMEHELRATRDGTVAEVLVRAGDQVVPGQLLVRYAGETR